MGRSLGGDSALYCQVVALLQGSPTPSTQDLHQVSSDWLSPSRVSIGLDLNPHLTPQI